MTGARQEGALGRDVNNEQGAAVRTPDEKSRLERQIAATDRESDLQVYELYRLTAEEVGMVEGG